MSNDESYLTEEHEITMLCFTGYGYHGDFISGWDEQLLGQAVNTCTNPSGRIEDCPVFNLQSTYDASKCDMNIPGILADEDVVGPMSSLPGDIQMGEFLGEAAGGILDPIGGGKDPAPGDYTSSSSPLRNTPDIGEAQQPTPETSVEPESTLVGPLAIQATAPASAPEAPVSDEPAAQEPASGQSDSVPDEPAAKESTPGESTPEGPVVTAAPEPIAPEEELDIISTEYIQDGNVLSKIVWVEDVVYVTETAYEICTQTPEPAKRKRAQAHMRRHFHKRH